MGARRRLRTLGFCRHRRGFDRRLDLSLRSFGFGERSHITVGRFTPVNLFEIGKSS
jgi:hypothetical protein